MEYVDTLKKYMSGKQYANKTVRSADGTIAYVTSTGVSKVYGSMEDYQETVGKRNCPEFIQLTPDWKDLGFPVGSLMKKGQACGHENTYVQAEPPETNFDWKFYAQNNQDLAKAGLTTEQQVTEHWNNYGKQEGRIPNATILSSMNALGKVGYIDVDTVFHKVPSTPGDYKTYASRSNITATQMEDCSKPLPSVRYGQQVSFLQGDKPGSINSSSLLEFNSSTTQFFLQPPPGEDRQGQVIRYGDKLCISSSASSYTSACGWWGCKVARINTETKQLEFGPGGEKTTTFQIVPPKGTVYNIGDEIKYGNTFSFVNISTPLVVGSPITCKTDKPLPNGVPGGVYRYTGNKTLQHYPNPDIANSWDSNWASASNIDCRNYRRGEDMTINNAANLKEGQMILWFIQKPFRFGWYRYVGNNVIRKYPSIQVMNSWDPKWKKDWKFIRNNTYTEGDPMTMNMDSPVNTDEENFAYVSNGVVVFGPWADAKGNHVFSFQTKEIDTSCNIEQLKQSCTDDCIGFVHSPNTNSWQKITPSTNYKITSTLQDFYIKDAKVDLKDASCEKGKVEFIDPTLFSNYPQGDDLKVGGANQCRVIDPPPSYKGKPLNTKEMKNYKPSIMTLQKKQQENTSYMKTKTKEYKEVSQGIKNTPPMDTLEQQYLDMTVFDSQNKTNLILWAILSTTIIAFVLIRK